MTLTKMDTKICQVRRILEAEGVRPDDLVDDPTLLGECSNTPHMLTELSFKERLAYEEKRLNSTPYPVKRSFRPRRIEELEDSNDDTVWNVDLNEGSEGYFDSKGKFIMKRCALEEDKKAEVFWLIKGKGNNIAGPFKSEEMMKKHINGELKNSRIKRETDDIFIGFSNLAAKFENPFLSGLGLDEVFKEFSKVEIERKRKDPVNGPPHPSKDKPKEKIKKKEFVDNKMEIEKVLKNCHKSMGFLGRRRCAVNLETIEEHIKGMDRAGALSYLDKVTGMSKPDNIDFLDLFITESKIKICKDVDADGFVTVAKGGKRGLKK
jgi:hypothetical protein